MEAKTLVLDIETYHTTNKTVLEALRRDAIEREPARNAPKAVKAIWNTDDAREERASDLIARTALDPLLAEVLCIGCKADGEEAQVFPSWETAASGYGDEPVALAAFSLWIDDTVGDQTTWIGHNICGFDLPILLNRFRAHGIVPPANFPEYRWGRWMGRVYDTMLRAPNKNGLGFVSCDALCQAYGLGPAKTTMWRGETMDGSRVAEAFEEEEYETILKYCVGDVEIEYKLYRAMTWDEKAHCPAADDADEAALLKILADESRSMTQRLAIMAQLMIDVGRAPASVRRALQERTAA